MAAYGALVSLSHILHQVLNPPPLNKIIIDRQQIEFLQGKVNFLIDFLETYPSRRNQEIADLEPQITDAAYEAEDIIESDVVEQIRKNNRSKFFSTLLGKFRKNNRSSSLSESIQTVLGKFLPIEEEMMKIKDREVNEDDLQPKIPTRATHPAGGKMTMVGFQEHVTQLMDALTTDEPTRQVIPIVGMGGIGKTTLASTIYNHPYVVEYFDVRAWVTVSQEYNVEDLLRLLYGITKEDSDDIGEKLYKNLYGRRYLIVMDDMWDIEVWDRVRRSLPVNDNGSRILVTTRISNLDFGSCSSHVVGLLDEENSWDLLRQKVFGKEDCPGELEEIGKSIAKQCGGLPLAIVVIGGLLAKSERTKEHWESVEGDVKSTINCGDGKQLMEILSLSYSHLPIYLKPCFLYLAVFPEDAKIPRFDLVRLWVSEGLIKLTQGKCLEEIADDYLEDLISRNLLLVSKRGPSGNVSGCKVHDLLRDLCISKAEKENFLYIAKLDNPTISPNIQTKRRLSISSLNQLQDKQLIEALQSARFTRSWTSFGDERSSPAARIVAGFRLLRVAHFERGRYSRISRHINIRYTCTAFKGNTSSMSQYWNLQTLQNVVELYLPTEIWQMPQIRHIKCFWGIRLPVPCDENVIVLENLQTLAVVKDFTFTAEVAERIPNLKNLSIRYRLESSSASGKYCLKNLVHFKKLESLELSMGRKLWSDITLPDSLKELQLKHCFIRWEDMSIVGKLPNLEALELKFNASSGKEWNPVEGEFRRLKYLMVWGSELEIWRAESCHFPSLQFLGLKSLPLEEIPMSLAEIISLEVIQIHPDKGPLWSSAKAISDEREVLGYETLLRLHGYSPDRYNFKLILTSTESFLEYIRHT